MRGGRLTIRGLPSTSSVSLVNACMLSRVRTFDSALSSSFARLGCVCALISGSTWSTSMWAYHTSRLVMSANERIAFRYSFTPVKTARRRCLWEKPSSRPAISTLVARRFTSHSQGPIEVSSKSLTSKTS